MITFMPFFLQMDLPFSIKKSETLTQLITVSNYLNQQQDVLLSVDQSAKFTIEDLSSEWKSLNFFLLIDNEYKSFLLH